MVFCNDDAVYKIEQMTEVTILILIDGFLQWVYEPTNQYSNYVTILILIDGFLQYK